MTLLDSAGAVVAIVADRIRPAAGGVQSADMAKRYTVSDGKMMLTLKPDAAGGFVVTSPIDPAMITQAGTVAEAFAMARDAFAALADSRADAERWTRAAGTRPARRRPAGQRPVGTGT